MSKRWIDAETGDYVVERGVLKEDDGFTSEVALALRTRLGSCLVLPSFGSRLHEVKRADEQGRRLSEKHAINALAHLTRKVDNLTVSAALSVDRPGAIELVVAGKRGQQALSAKYTTVV